MSCGSFDKGLVTVVRSTDKTPTSQLTTLSVYCDCVINVESGSSEFFIPFLGSESSEFFIPFLGSGSFELFLPFLAG